MVGRSEAKNALVRMLVLSLFEERKIEQSEDEGRICSLDHLDLSEVNFSW